MDNPVNMKPVTVELSERFIGREAELALLQARLTQATTGRGRLMFLSGEAGVGKTLLLQEFAHRAAGYGALVYSGCAFEGEWQPPYYPWTEMLAEHIRSSDPTILRAQFGLAAQALFRLIPDIQALLADLPAPPPLSADEERFRLYNAVVQFILRQSMERTVVLTLDDLHWADRDSLNLLRYLARFVARSRLLFVGVFRETDMELSHQHPLAHLLAILQRESRYEEIVLRGFDLEEVGEYLSSVARQPLPYEMVRFVHNQTEGNPFFVREVTRQLLAEGQIVHERDRWVAESNVAELGAPMSVHRILNIRLARVSPATKRLLAIVACFRGRFTFDSLLPVSGLSEDELLDCLDEALRAGFLCVAERSTASYDFAHPIVRQAVYEELNLDRRARFHLKIATALESVYTGQEVTHAATLAVHHHAAGSLCDRVKGASYALYAAEQATSSYAYQRAVTFLRMARDLATDTDPAQRAEVLTKLAVAEAEALLLDDASATAERALEVLTEARAGPEERASFLATIARLLKEAGGNQSVWGRFTEEGLALLDGRRDLLWARLALLLDNYEVISTGTINAGRWLGLDPEAVAIARELGDEDDYARTLDPWKLRTSEETESVLALARTWKNPGAAMWALEIAGHDYYYRDGDSRRAIQCYSELLQMARQYGSIPLQATALTYLTGVRLSLWDLLEAKSVAAQAKEMIISLGSEHPLHIGSPALDFLIAFHLGDEAEWARLAEKMSTQAANPELRRGTAAGLFAGACAAYCKARAGESESARQIIGALAQALVRLGPEDFYYPDALIYTALAVWELGDAEFAASLRNMLKGAVAAGCKPLPTQGRMGYIIACMSALLGDMEQASAGFAEARSKLQPEMRSFGAILDYLEAMALVRNNSLDRTRILGLLERSIGTCHELKLDGWARRAVTLRDTISPTRPVQLPSKPHYPSGLTPREIEVLQLLAVGQTNLEIATELVVSRATVERHLANMYNKIGVSCRAKAVAYAFTHGIVLNQVS